MYYCATDAIAETISNCPTPHAFTLLVEKMSGNDSIQTFKTWCDSNGYNATVFVRSGYPNWGNGWRQLATATPPQEFDLPLADGISNYATSVYHKNQFNEVSVRVSISATNAIQNGATIATLPEGFRPAKAIDTDATGYVSGSSWFACRLVIQPSGAVQVYCGIGSSTATFIVGSFEPYLAAN